MNEYYIERAENRRYERNYRSRIKKRNYSFKLFLMIIIFVFSIIISIFSFKHSAYADDSENVIKQYRSIMIYCGDSVESISNSYIDYGYSDQGAFIKEVCSINSISSDCRLIAGNYIIIPYYETSL